MKIFFFLSIAVGLWGRLLAGEQATAVATVTAGFVTGITVTSGGSGYRTEPEVTLSGGGGNGATAKAVLSGDQVSVVIVLKAGSGYKSAPTVILDAPPKALSLRVELVPKLTLEGPAWSMARVQSAETLAGPWTTWSNVPIRADGVVLVDLTPGSAARFYRSVAALGPAGPIGFVWIAPGTFQMGSPTSEAGRKDNEVQHTVTLTHGFWMCDHEVTQKEYETVMGSNPSPSEFRGSSFPVENVTWDNAVTYCQSLTLQERNNALITEQLAYRLPTEAEWEYAARAGSPEPWYGNLDEIAWYSINSGYNMHEARQKAPNAWGLFDMSGNVAEWCSDWYGEYPTESVSDPTGPIVPSSFFNSGRVFRGGGLGDGAERVRSAHRDGILPFFRGFFLGFRPVLSSVR